MLDCEVTLDSALFDPAVRDDLTTVFAKALHSDYCQRFDNAEEMLRAWRRLFASVDRPTTETDNGTAVELGQSLAGATEETSLVALGLSPRLLDALERIGAQTVGQLLNLPRIRLYRNQGLGQKTVREIRQLAERLAQHFATQGEQPLPVPMEELEPDEPRAAPEQLSVDLMARLLVPQRLETGEGGILLAFMGLDSGNAGGAWVGPSRSGARACSRRPRPPGY
jgi:hypothetical protein